MTVPKWLVPALAIVAALAVGVAATLLGRALATPDAVAIPSGTAVVPVLAPVPEPPHPSDAESGDAESSDHEPGDAETNGDAPVSETVAEREITLPASDPDAIDPALGELIGTLADAADPVFTLMELETDRDSHLHELVELDVSLAAPLEVNSILPLAFSPSCKSRSHEVARRRHGSFCDSGCGLAAQEVVKGWCGFARRELMAGEEGVGDGAEGGGPDRCSMLGQVGEDLVVRRL